MSTDLQPRSDSLGAFVPGPRLELGPRGIGSLAGTVFAIKDNYDVAGHVTGCGNPDWARTHDPAAADAAVVETLLGAGAHAYGKTILNELAYGITGENIHYGTPANPNAPGRLPGGSSSGSAAAVAGGLVDFALGSDTGGSIRIPASFCGLYGLRPTHGAVATEGMVPLAPGFDTAGWLARDPDLLRSVGKVLLPADAPPAELPETLLIAEDVFELAEPGCRKALETLLEDLVHRFHSVRTVRMTEPEGGRTLVEAFQVIQGTEIIQAHGEWLQRVGPRFADDVAARLDRAARFTAKEMGEACAVREAACGRMAELLVGRTVLAVPSTPVPAPPVGLEASELAALRTKVLSVTCLSPLARLPEISLPLATAEGLPIGLGLMAAPRHDSSLLALAESLWA